MATLPIFDRPNLSARQKLAFDRARRDRLRSMRESAESTNLMMDLLGLPFCEDNSVPHNLRKRFFDDPLALL